MKKTFRQRLMRLPFMAALLIGVLGMPTEIYAYNQRHIGTAHAEPWTNRSAFAKAIAGVGVLWTSLMAVLRSPHVWRAALPAATMVLISTGVIHAEHGVLIAGITVNDLLEQKRAKLTEANAIRDRVYKDQAGEWRGDDTAKFDALMTDVEGITAQYTRLAKLDAAAKSLEEGEQPRERRSAVVDPNLPSQRRGGEAKVSAEDRAMAIHGWFAAGSAEGAAIVTERHVEAARRCGLDLSRPNISLRLPQSAMTGDMLDVRGNIRPEALAAWEKRLTQVDVVSPDLGGHYTVPDEMMRPLEVALLQFGGMRQVASIIRTQTGAELPTPTLNDTSNKGALLGEGQEHTELDTEFNQLLLHAYKYTSRRVPVSVEFLQDNAVNFVSRIGSILGERIGRITNDHFTIGDGNSKPNGIVTAATSSGVTTATSSAISYDNLVELKHSVDPAFRSQGAGYMFNDATLLLLKKIKVPQFSGDTAGQPLWRAGMTAGEPDTIDGDRYTINQSMESGASKKAVLYGLLSKYLIRDVRDITLVRLDERYAELGVVAFLAFSRHDGDLLDAGTHPVKYLTMHS